MPMLSGKSCIVDSIIVPFSPSRDVTDRSVLRRLPPGPGRSTPVVHPRVPHGEDGGVLVELERAVDDLAEEERVPAELDRLPDLAVEVRDRLVEDRRAGGAVMERESR